MSANVVGVRSTRGDTGGKVEWESVGWEEFAVAQSHALPCYISIGDTLLAYKRRKFEIGDVLLVKTIGCHGSTKPSPVRDDFRVTNYGNYRTRDLQSFTALRAMCAIISRHLRSSCVKFLHHDLENTP